MSNSDVLVSPPSTKTVYLNQRFNRLRQLLDMLDCHDTSGRPKFGTLYKHYQRYLAITAVCKDLSLDLSQPSQSISVIDEGSGSTSFTFAPSDIISWAGFTFSTFINNKKRFNDLARINHQLCSRREDLLSQADLAMLASLELFRQSPLYFQGHRADATELKWTISSVDERLAPFLSS